MIGSKLNPISIDSHFELCTITGITTTDYFIYTCIHTHTHETEREKEFRLALHGYLHDRSDISKLHMIHRFKFKVKHSHEQFCISSANNLHVFPTHLKDQAFRDVLSLCMSHTKLP